MIYFVMFIMKGKKLYMFYWFGCDVIIRGMIFIYCDKYIKVIFFVDF